MILRPALASDLDAMERIHADSFAAPWSAADLTAVMAGPGVHTLVAQDAAALGFVMVRAAGDQAEVLTIAVTPALRRRGVGAALMTAASAWARAAGAEALFLEAAADSPAALGLYAALGFHAAGVRKGYYMRAGAASVDAHVLRRALNTDEP